MAKIVNVLRRLDALGMTNDEAHGVLGSIAVIAPEALEEALNSLENKRLETRRPAA